MNLYYMIKLKLYAMKIILFYIVATTSIYGQEVSDTFDPSLSVFSASPNVSQINKYIEQPVNYSTGIPQINVPIYVVNQGNIQVPITLDYHAGGIKVSQEASNVGLGWSLNAGGVLSREIRGIIDDFKRDHRFGGVMYATKTLVDIAEIPPGYENQDQEQIFYEQLKEVDHETDLFSYSLPSINGQFVYSQEDQKFYELEKSNNKIEYETESTSIQRIYQWTIKDSDGTKYIFGEETDNTLEAPLYCETNFRNYFGSNSLPSVTYTEPIGIVSWYLRKIIDKNGNEINFEYGTNNGVEYVNRNPQFSDGGFGNHTGIYNKVTVNEKYLKKITFKEGYVDFIYSTEPRNDLKNSKKLSTIKIYERNFQTNQSSLIKEVELNHSYFDYVVTNGANHPENIYNYSRLKLNSVILKGNLSNSDEIIYKFEYDPTLLPQKFSYSQDYWGGYNGKDNSNLTPPATFYSYVHNSYTNHGNENIERQVEKDYVTAGILNKIIYPTGGYTKYYYEPNTVSDFTYLGGFYNTSDVIFIRNIKNPYKLNEFLFEYNVHNQGGGNCSKVPVDVGTFRWNIVCPFIVNNRLQSQFRIIDELTSYTCPEGSVQTDIDSYPGIDPETGEPQVLCNFRPPRFQYPNGMSIENWLFLEPGEYNMIIPFNGSPQILDPIQERASVQVKLHVKEDETPEKRVIGGVRVNKIENYDTNDTLLSQRIFQYEFNEGQSIVSSGKSILPRFGIYESIYVRNLINYSTPINREVFYMSDININSLATNKVAYNKIKEEFVNALNPLEDYSKIYHYNNSSYRFTNNFYREENPFVRKFHEMDISWNNKLKEEEIIDENNNLLNHAIYTNQQNTGKEIFSGFRIHDMSMEFDGNLFLRSRFIIDYKNYSSYSTLEETEVLQYSQNNNIEAVTKYNYSGANPLLVSSQTTTTSLGEELKTEYKYPQDLLTGYDQSTLMNGLVAKNMLSTPVITKTYNGVTQLTEQQTRYKDFGSGQILPEFVYLKKGSTSFENKITYNRYDSKGNLEQYTLADGTPVSIIWGYNGQYPIAKVEGKTYTEIASLAGTLQTASNNGTLTAGSFESLRSLAGAVVTGYIYQPLVGVTTIIQPNGQKETYEYDSFGRLMHVKDGQGNILRQIDYNYQQP